MPKFLTMLEVLEAIKGLDDDLTGLRDGDYINGHYRGFHAAKAAALAIVCGAESGGLHHLGFDDGRCRRCGADVLPPEKMAQARAAL